MSIDLNTVDNLANLSKLEFDDEGKEEIRQKLNTIVEFISQLQEVDTENVEPMASTVHATSTRERADEVTESDHRDAYMKNSPQSEMGFFVVPRVIE
jgi:aspartyl-tRNA(Asn)/glutamyl-tRNA(Gln) amidotransferase subunit C